MFLLNFIAVLALASAYVGLRLLPALPLGPAGIAVGVAVLCLPVALAVASLAAALLGGAAFARRLRWAGSLTLGWVSMLVLLTLLREPVLAIGTWLASGAAAAALREYSAAAVPALALLATAEGMRAALVSPRLVQISIPCRELAGPLDGFSIVQITDLHIGATIRRRAVEHIVERVNRLRPDLIAITGDLVDGSVAELAPHVAPLGRLAARHGVCFVTGNHEYYSGAEHWIRELRRLGMRVLTNEHLVIRHGTAELVVAGIPDPVARRFDARMKSDPAAALVGAPAGARPRILLAHRPGSALAAEAAGFDLQLSGHTHGGQFWPWNLVVRWREPFSIGLDRLRQLWIYTSRGTGFWGPPQRLGVPAEITRITLVRAVPQASGRRCGNSSTSRIEGESVSSITSRSTPRPRPAVGGMPYSSARI